MTLPLVPPISQFDGGPHASENCTCASGARLLLYATGKHATGSEVRRMQSDQSGGTSLPDVMRGLHNGWSFEPTWASGNDGVPVPAHKYGTSISVSYARELLGDRYMLMWQGDYGEMPPEYREQVSFTGDHCYTVDAFQADHLFKDGHRENAYFVVDTIPRKNSGYRGRWIPARIVERYGAAIAGKGRIYAAWARPLPDTSEDVMEAFSIPQAPSIAEAVRDTKLYTKSDLTGSSYPVSAGDTKRLIGNPAGDKTVLIIGHDRSPDVEGKSALYGKAADWKVQVSP